MRRELGLHDVAGGATELNRVHLLHGAIAELAGDHHVRDRHYGEEDAHAAPSDPPVFDFVQTLDNFVLGECNADGDLISPAKNTIGIAMKIKSVRCRGWILLCRLC